MVDPAVKPRDDGWSSRGDCYTKNAIHMGVNKLSANLQMKVNKWAQKKVQCKSLSCVLALAKTGKLNE